MNKKNDLKKWIKKWIEIESNLWTTHLKKKKRERERECLGLFYDYRLGNCIHCLFILYINYIFWLWKIFVKCFSKKWL